MCLKNTSPRKCSEILTIPGVHLVILPLHSSPDRVFLHRSRCGDRNFPSTLYKSNTVRNHCIFADWSFWETFSSGVLKNNLGVQKIKFVSTTDEGFAEVWNLSFQQNSYRRWQSSRCQNFDRHLVAMLLLWFVLSSPVFLSARFWHAQLLFSSVRQRVITCEKQPMILIFHIWESHLVPSLQLPTGDKRWLRKPSLF